MHENCSTVAVIIANRIDSRESDCSNSKIISAPFCLFYGLEPTYHPIRVHLLHSDWMICRSNTSKMAPRQFPFHDLFNCLWL